jgi:uncharacterized membrane protein
MESAFIMLSAFMVVSADIVVVVLVIVVSAGGVSSFFVPHAARTRTAAIASFFIVTP